MVGCSVECLTDEYLVQLKAYGTAYARRWLRPGAVDIQDVVGAAICDLIEAVTRGDPVDNAKRFLKRAVDRHRKRSQREVARSVHLNDAWCHEAFLVVDPDESFVAREHLESSAVNAIRIVAGLLGTRREQRHGNVSDRERDLLIRLCELERFGFRRSGRHWKYSSTSAARQAVSRARRHLLELVAREFERRCKYEDAAQGVFQFLLRLAQEAQASRFRAVAQSGLEVRPFQRSSREYRPGRSLG